MNDESTQAARGDSAGALGIVLAASAVQFVIARVLLTAQGGAARVGTAGRDALDLAVVTCGITLLCVLWLRARQGRAAALARELPLLQVLVPTPACGIAMWWSGDDTHGAAAVLPVLASVFAAGCLVAVVMARAMATLVLRGGVDGVELVDPAPAWRAHVAAMLAPTAAVAAIAAASLVQESWPVGLVRGTTAMWTGGLLLVVVAVAAARSGAVALTIDIEGVARRLDHLGHGTAPIEARPFVAVEPDDVAALLGELERLRARLEQEQRVYQDALERTQAADAAKAEFLSAVSHELRTPLHTVGGYAQLLLSGIPAPLSTAQADDVRLIQAGGRQLLELVNDILDLSMIESGDLRLHFASHDVGALLDEVVRIHQPLVRDRDVTLRADLAELPDVVCDRRRIFQILTNLLSNAIKFTEHGSIVVRADALGTDRVAIAVSDTGVGIAPDELPLIFDEYQQAGTISRRKKGTGLGLAIARSIALAHGGTLSVASEPGRGSTFTLVLPIDPPRRPTTIDIAEEAARAVVRARSRSDTWEQAQ